MNDQTTPGPSKSKPPRRSVMLLIMDGIGVNPSRVNNAVAQASTPNLDHFYSSYPTTLLEASGLAVGLPDGQMGNSEVGHLTLGCGSVLRQDLVKINDSVADGSLAGNPVLLEAIRRAKSQGRPMHLLGLVSDGGVHSHVAHLLELIRICGIHKVRPLVHMITDGRDTAPQIGTRYLSDIEPALRSAQGAIASICGRFYALDRDKRWERVFKAWSLLINGEGIKAAGALEGIESAWAREETDEFINPIVLPDFEPMQENDEVVFFNFRNDRPRELSEALALAEFEGFDRAGFKPVNLTTLTRYDVNYPFAVLFEKEVPEITVGEVVASYGIKQLRSAETEKYPHVTFFFSGGREEPFPGEDRVLVDSPKVETYDLAPEMSALGIRDEVIKALESQEYGLLVVNLANGDMVGHTGVPEAVVRAVEVVDEVVGQLCHAAIAHDTSVILTADHGNADMLIDPVTGDRHTQHTTFPVACAIIDPSNWRLANGRGLPAIAPAILQLMGLQQPIEMTGQSLLLEEV